MTRPDSSHGSAAAEPEEFDATYWEDRYRSGIGTSKRNPSPSLVSETSNLPAGRALDAGCGVGGDSLWLAARGWQVTAADISTTALAEGRRVAETAGPDFASRIDWVQADLTTWEPDGASFDLVTSHYVHVPGPQEVLFQRLASWVAPGGTLLVVGHDAGHGHGHGHGEEQGHGHGPAHEHVDADGPPPHARVGVQQIVAHLAPEQWDVVVAEPRKHTIERPDNGEPVTLHDVVVHARRRESAA
jgi:SAM-dependent methyltransferase